MGKGWQKRGLGGEEWSERRRGCGMGKQVFGERERRKKRCLGRVKGVVGEKGVPGNLR